jgi:hypothetical protein
LVIASLFFTAIRNPIEDIILQRNQSTQSWKRYELKFLISAASASLLRERFKRVLTPDSHGPAGYGILSAYFDTPNRQAIDEKLAGTLVRNKYRIRSYTGGGNVWKLERKSKTGDTTSKQSCQVNYEHVKAMLDGDYTSWPFSHQFRSEAQATMMRKMTVQMLAGGLRPVTMVSYFREAWEYPWDIDNKFRVTLDQNISYSNDWDILLNREQINTGTPVMSGQSVVLEIKFNQGLPVFLQPLFAGMPKLRSAVSKYIYSVMKESDYELWRIN